MRRVTSRWAPYIPRHCPSSHVFAPVLSTSSALGTPSSLLVSRRTVASYPSPGVRSRQSKKKKYNFLNSARLVPVPRRRESRAVIRQRDDVGIIKRQEYRRQLQLDIEEKIHYFPPFLVNFVFYPKVRNMNKRKIFTGNRVLAVRTFTRVYIHVMDQLLAKDKRKALFALIEEGGLEAPSTAALKPYVDARTGDITNLGILYSQWMKRRLHDAWARLDGMVRKCESRRAMTPTLAYLARYHADLQRVPSLQQWSDAIGPLRQDELVEFSKSYVNVHRAMMHAKREIESYGKDIVEQAVQGLTMQEESELMQYVEAHASELRESLRRAHYNASLILFGINRLPEIRAIQAPSRVFHQEEESKWAVEHNGHYSPPCPHGKEAWSQMSPDQKSVYYCFKRKFERRTNTGSQLYTRYCIRDYGIPKSDAQKRFTQLSDLQNAAINFPFYYSIAPKNSSTVAFRRFYHAMCSRYGLTRGTGNTSFGNRLFEAAMRRKWNELDADERHQYYESDAIRAAFPLLPTAAPRRRDVSDNATKTRKSEHLDRGGDPDDDTQAVRVHRDEGEDEEMAATADMAVQNAKPVRRRLAQTRSAAAVRHVRAAGDTPITADNSRVQRAGRTPLFLYATENEVKTAHHKDGRKSAPVKTDVPSSTSRRTVVTV